MALSGVCYSCGNYKPQGLPCKMCALNQQKPRTQKGKGLVALREVVGNTVEARFATEPNHIPEAGWPFFCRPAPSQPRHGYIDSRLVTKKEEADKLLAEVLADDPKGELILCPLVKAKWNAVLTPNSLVVGAGNDGATAGKDTAMIPLLEFKPVQAGVMKNAGIKTGDWPFLEIVQVENQAPVFTQLRGGPSLPNLALGNIVAEKTVVKHVLHADPDVFKDLGWEKAVEEAKPGTVVWHPGGALSDHFSIHAFLHKLPIIFDAESPKVGDVLEPTGDNVPTYDPIALLKGFVAGDVYPIKNIQHGEISNSLVAAMLVALHNAAVMTGESSKWIGFGAAIMIRLGATAMRGEARHAGFCQENWKGKPKGSKPIRENVYARYCEKSLSYHRASMNRLTNIFRYAVWQSSGFGGPKWACGGAALAELLNAIRTCAIEQSPDSAAQVVAKLNLAVNQVHNGGWWLNKFASVDLFNQIPKGKLEYIAKPMGIYGQAHKIMKTFASKSKANFVQKRIAKYAAWPVTTLTPPFTNTVQVSYHPTAGQLKMTVVARAMGEHMKGITATVAKKLSAAELKAMKTRTYLVETHDGYRLEVKPEEGKPIVLWEEDSLAKMALTNSPNKQGD